MSIDRLSIAPGDTVDVPWGLDTLPATVLEVYESAGRQRVRVRLQRSGIDAPEEAVLRVTDLAASAPPSKYTSPGSWQHVHEYEEEFAQALRELLGHLTSDPVAVAEARTSGLPGRADLIARVGGHTIVVELKWQLRDVQNAVEQASRFAEAPANGSTDPTSIIISSPNSPRVLLDPSADGPVNLAPNVFFVRWSGPGDNENLGHALRDVLDSPAA